MMEQMYGDFTTKLLPKIGEGLSMTKEYFTELFGRYVKYLIVMDSIGSAMSVLVFLVTLFCIAKYLPRTLRIKDQWGDVSFANMIWLIALIPLLVSLGMTFTYTENLAKDLIVPEIRVMEEIGRMINGNKTN